MPILTKAQQLAAQYSQTHAEGVPPDPSLNPAWNDRAPVPSPPRRDNAPRIVDHGEKDEFGRETFAIADGGGSSAPVTVPEDFRVAAATSLFVPQAVRNTPTWQAAGSQDAIDERAVKAAGEISYLIERAPDEAMKYFRRTLSHPQTGILVFGQLDEKVRDELSATFMRIALRKPWVFQVCRLLLSIRGHISGPNLFRAVCSIATFHAFLAYADIVSPYGNLESVTAAEELTSEEQIELEQEDKTLAALLAEGPEVGEVLKAVQKTIEADTGVDLSDPKWDDNHIETAEEKAARHAREGDGLDDPEDPGDEEFLSPEALAELTDDEMDKLTRPE